MDKHLLSPCMTSIVYIYATGSMKIMFGITNAETQARTHARTHARRQPIIAFTIK